MAVRTPTLAETRAQPPPSAAEQPVRGWRTDLLWGVATALLAVLLACLVIRVWRGELGIPFVDRGETQYNLMLAKSMRDHGSYNVNPSLGAPFGLKLYDYGVGTDQLNLLAIGGLAFLFGPVAALNLFYLLTFGLAAAAALLVFRLLGIARAPAAVCSILFALAPYHFARNEGHLFLSAYYAVPLGAYLVLATLGGLPLFARRPGRTGPLAYASWRTLTTIAFCILVGSAGVYYAAFTLLLLGGATLIALLARAGRRAVANGVLSGALVALAVFANLIPSILYRLHHGPNLLTRRPTADSELLGLKFANLILPDPDSHLGPLSRLSRQYLHGTPLPSETGQALGLVGAIGFLGLLAIAFLAIAGRSRVGPPIVRHASAAALLAFLIGTVGGISAIIVQVLTAQIRAWNRISIVIAFFAFLAVAVALERGGVTIKRLRLPSVVYPAALAAVLALGLFGQVAKSDVPPYDLSGAWRNDQAFFRQIEQRLPRGASVFVLPYQSFPEAGQLVDLDGNDLLRGYLHTKHLRWSFGAMKGRSEDWSTELQGLPTSTTLDAAVTPGFSGLWIDRFGYMDRAAALENDLHGLVGPPAIVDAEGRDSFYDLRPFAQRLERSHSPAQLAALRQAVLHPLQFIPTGFLPLLRSESQSVAWADAPNASMGIDNPSKTPRTAVFDAILDRVGGPNASVTVTFPGSPPATVQTPSHLHQQLTLPPGVSVIQFSTTAPPIAPNNANGLRLHWLRLNDMTVTDRGFAGFQ
jgi:phosphoglycerol transferase